MNKKEHKPYSDRTDIEKIESNWKKITGLLERKEWSSAIVRAATTAEIATNLIIREELENKRGLEKDFVDHLLLWANGIQGKFQKLILPTTKKDTYHKDFKKLQKIISDLNRERNSIVHQGQFKKKTTAIKVSSEARIIINCLVDKYHDNFELQKINV